MLTKEEQDDLDRHIRYYNNLQRTERESRANINVTPKLPSNTYHNPNTLKELQEYFKSPAVQVHQGNRITEMCNGGLIFKTVSIPIKGMYRRKLLLV